MPLEPASTTLARRMASNLYRVSWRASTARTWALVRTFRKLSDSSLGEATDSAHLRMTVIIVPSFGSAMASYMVRTAARTDRPKWATEISWEPHDSAPRPCRNWAKMTPELPRAPSRAAAAMAADVTVYDRCGRTRSMMARTVEARLDPVSASGTGKTLIRSSSFWFSRIFLAPARKA